MAIQFQRLTMPGEGVSSLLDFAPLAGAIEGYGQSEKARLIGQAAQTGGNTAAAQEALKQGNLEAGALYQNAADKDKDRAQADKDRQIKMLGGVAQAAKYEQDPARRALIWQTGLKRAGINPADLDPDELDPMTGPDVFLGASGKAEDPRESQLMDLKIAQANKNLVAPVGDQETFYGSPQYERTQDGSTKAFILGNRGTKKYIDAGDGATLLGPGGVAYDKAFNTVAGREGAEKKMSLPKVETTLKMQEVSDRVVIQDIDRALAMTDNPWATGFTGSLSNYVANTPGSNLSRMLDGIQANIGFDKLQDMRNNSPTGGALGAVTERELALLQSVYGSLVNSQSAEDLKFNLNRLKEVRQQFAQLRREAYDRDVQTFGAAAVPNPETGAQPQGGAQGGKSRAVPPQAADVLRRDPSPDAIREFNEVFGPGAAEGLLNGR